MLSPTLNIMLSSPPGTVLCKPVGSPRKFLAAFVIITLFVWLFLIAFFGIVLAAIPVLVMVALFVLVSKNSLLAMMRWNQPALEMEPASAGDLVDVVCHWLDPDHCVQP